MCAIRPFPFMAIPINPASYAVLLQLVIKLRTKTNTDYFLDCCSREERDIWALDITGAIHAGNPVQVQQLHLMKNSFKLPANISLKYVVNKFSICFCMLLVWTENNEHCFLHVRNEKSVVLVTEPNISATPSFQAKGCLILKLIQSERL